MYLLPMPERTAGAFRDCVSHLAGYVSHDMTTPLGAALEQARAQPVGFDRSPFRTFGTYGVWFPRGLLLRAAAQKICLSLLKEWKTDAAPADFEPVKRVVTEAATDPRLKPESVRQQIEEEAVRGADGGPADQIERWLIGLEGQVTTSGRHPDAGEDAVADVAHNSAEASLRVFAVALSDDHEVVSRPARRAWR